jgi:hypothetical protein
VNTELTSLEREMEETRVRLAGTIDELVHRASPKTMVSREITKVRAHFVAADGSPRTDNILKVAGGVVGVIALIATLRWATR